MLHNRGLRIGDPSLTTAVHTTSPTMRMLGRGRLRILALLAIVSFFALLAYLYSSNRKHLGVKSRGSPSEALLYRHMPERHKVIQPVHNVEEGFKSEFGNHERYQNYQKLQHNTIEIKRKENNLVKLRKGRHGLRFVHLDLKGAPPKIGYFKEFFPLIRRFGANGLLMEYEDMFPYSGKIKRIAAGNAYTKSEIETIVSLAHSNDLQIIPLIQTFGHMEYVLKYREFAHMREVSEYPMAINPNLKESLELIQNMANQVLALHKNASWIHIGCDEVYHLGLSSQSVNTMQKENIGKDELFFRHVKAVAGGIVKLHPNVQPLIWDDMMRGVDESLLVESEIGSFIEPMIWCYQPDVATQLDMDMWRRYSKVFPNVWAASSFKGATGPAQFITDIDHHVQNHVTWLNMINEVEKTLPINFEGVALTGWQRFDHFAVLCELLPAAIPSLVSCLTTLTSGNWKEAYMANISKRLRCDHTLNTSLGPVPTDVAPEPIRCSFPGGDIFTEVQKMWVSMDTYKQLISSIRLDEYLTDYHKKYNFTSNSQVEYTFEKRFPVQFILSNFGEIRDKMRSALMTVYDKYTVHEWLETHILAHMRKVKKIYNSAQPLLKKRYWPGRPFPIQKIS